MSRSLARALFGSLFVLAWLTSARVEARAPDTWDEDYATPYEVESPMWMALEIKTGPYLPEAGRAFDQVFGGDKGWMLALELDVTIYHIPYVGQLNVAGGWGWANYDAKALTADGRSGEETELTLYPLSLMGVLRIDALARYTVVPVQFAAKLGYDWVRWKSTTGEREDGSGFNQGLRWAVQAALELDFFERGIARRLDEDWGINHTLLIAEFLQSRTNNTGDKTFQIGIGLQF